MPAVVVRPQASGRGEIAIDTGGDVYAGDTGRSIKITYTSIGQIQNGRLRLALPVDWSEPTDDNVDIASGSTSYDRDTEFGGGMSEPPWKTMKISVVPINSLSQV